MDAFAEGVVNITEVQQQLVYQYFGDVSIQVTAGTFDGKDTHYPDIRQMFTHQPWCRVAGTANGWLPSSYATAQGANATCVISRRTWNARTSTPTTSHQNSPAAVIW
jgi:hypothetical protein